MASRTPRSRLAWAPLLAAGPFRLLLVPLALVGACAGPSVCRPGSCGTGVCDLDGQCRELGVRREVRGAESLRLAARSDARAPDVLRLGSAPVSLRFPPAQRPRVDADVVEAILVMYPASLATPSALRRLTVSGPGRTVGRWLALRPDRPLRVDVTDHARRARGAMTLQLRVGGAGDVPWRIAGPNVRDLPRRPHLELRLRPAAPDDTTPARPPLPGDRSPGAG